MKLEWIEDILAVHDTGSLRAAADIRFLTASAFTRRIKAVEKAIGSELFDRSNKPVTLRPHVVELIPRMREASVHLKVIQNELLGLDQKARITRIICQHTLTVSWAPKVVKALAQSDTQIRIRSGSKDECSFGVLKNDVDIALVYEEPDVVIDMDLFERIHMAQEEFVPVAALKNNDSLASAIDRKSIPLISYPRSIFLGGILEKTLSKQTDPGVNFVTLAESGLGPAVLEFVRAGLGVGWLPESLIQNEIENGHFTPMTDIIPSFRLDITALSAKSPKSHLQSRLWETIETQFGSR